MEPQAFASFPPGTCYAIVIPASPPVPDCGSQSPKETHMQNEASRTISTWPEESREAAQLVIDAYGDPTETTESLLIWQSPGPWKRIVASKTFYQHAFPAPHIDAVESVVDYRVPVDKFSAIAEFDGSVVIERTAGEVSARCHDEQANFLALNLMHELATGVKDVAAARAYYRKEFLGYRSKQPTPYMEGLRFTPIAWAADPDERVISDEELQRAEREGKAA
jgi:hypothetical protein